MASNVVSMFDSRAARASIFQAAASNSVAAIKRALERGESVNSQDQAGWTPLHHAAANLAHDAASFLLRVPGIDATMRDGNGYTADILVAFNRRGAGRRMEYQLVPFCHPWLVAEFEGNE